MLKLKYLFENYDLAKECLALYDYEKEGLDEMLSHFRISSNAIYPFRTKSGKTCFLRLSPCEEKLLNDIRSEVLLVNWLNSEGYPAMKTHPMKSGIPATQIATKWGDYNVTCFEKVPGKTLEEADGSPELCYGYGKTLGKLHSLMMDYPYSLTRRDHTDLIAEVRGRLVKYNAPGFILDELTEVEKELQSLPITVENYGIVHYDFEPDNVMYDPKTGAFGVIDFDDAIRCWYALDIVRAIDAIDDVMGEPENAANHPELLDQAFKHFLDGYMSEKSLTKEQTDTLPLMRRLVRLQSYATILHVMSEEVSESPDWMLEIKEKLRRSKQKIESGIAEK